MTSARTFRRLMRRELHSSRAAATITVCSLLALVSAWAGVEVALALSGLPALVVAPHRLLSIAAHPLPAPPAAVAAAGVLIGAAGLLVLVLAVVGGRRGRHGRRTGQGVIVVDDRVIASSIAARAAASARLGRGQVRVSVSRRLSIVRLTPTSGRPIDAETVRADVVDTIDRDDMRPRLRPRIDIASGGSVGA